MYNEDIILGKLRKNREQLENIIRYPIKKHKILMVEPPWTAGNLSLNYPEDVFKAGMSIEVCGYNAFVDNADVWKNEFDVFCLHDISAISYVTEVTTTQIYDAIQKFMDNGVFVFLFSTASDNMRIRKYGALGVIDATQDVSMNTLFSGLQKTTKDLAAGTGSFQHGANYPFNVEVLKTECVPKGGYMNHFSSADTETVYPITATQEATVANITAYKPNKFFVLGTAGAGGATIDNQGLFKYIKYGELLSCILGKTKNIRMSLDCQYGRRIAAVGVDCDVTIETAGMEVLTTAFKGKPLELGLVASYVTDDLAGWYRGKTENQKIELVSHTNSHFHEETKITVTDEIHIVGSDHLIKLNRPFRSAVLSVKTTDDVTTFTKGTGNIDTGNPTTSQYVYTPPTDSYGTESAVAGLLKFNADKIGVSVKVTYTCDDEALMILGSLNTLRAKGCLTAPCVYLTGGYTATSPSTFTLADKDDVALCAYEYFPGYAYTHAYRRMRTKRPLPVGTISKPGWNRAVVDVQFFSEGSKDFLKTTYFPDVFNRSIAMDLPYVFYIHDFPYSESHGSSLFLGSTYDADWKKADIATTRAYVLEFWQWFVAQMDTQNVYWMSRSQYVRRYEYINRYLVYDVINTSTIVAENKGSKPILGLTYRIPSDTEPTAIKIGDKTLDYAYADGVITTWFDLLAGQKVSIIIS